MLKKIREFFGSEFALIIMIILMMSSALFFALIQKTNEPNCQIVACQYKDKIMPTANILGFILFLPTIAIWYLKWLNPIVLIASFILVVPYWYLIGLLIDWIIRLFTKKQRKKIEVEDPVEKLKFSFRFSFYSMLIFTFFIGAISFLYYPDMSIEVTFDKFLLIATATVAVSAFILNFYKGKSSEEVAFRNGIKKLTEITVFFLIIGTFMTFMMSNRLPQITQTIVDKASMNSFQMAFMAAGLLGLTNILFMLVQRKPAKSGPKKEINSNSK